MMVEEIDILFLSDPIIGLLSEKIPGCIRRYIKEMNKNIHYPVGELPRKSNNLKARNKSQIIKSTNILSTTMLMMKRE